MSFFEVRFPTDIAPGPVGGPSFLTEIIPLKSGAEQREVGWDAPLQRYSVSLVNRPQSELDTFIAFFRIVKGRGHGFRLKDWTDYLVTVANGRLGTTALGTGALAYSLYKRYTSSGSTDDRRIVKPVSGSVTVYRNAAPVTVGAGAGQIAIDYTTGIVTFVPDSTKTITAITQANPGQVTATAHGFSNGDLIYIDSVVGMTQVNGLVFTIAGVTADTFTIGVNTTSYTAYASGGNAKKGPQPADALTWAGEFDVPVRLDVDAMQASVRPAAGGRLLATWDSIELVELRRT